MLWYLIYTSTFTFLFIVNSIWCLLLHYLIIWEFGKVIEARVAPYMKICISFSSFCVIFIIFMRTWSLTYSYTVCLWCFRLPFIIVFSDITISTSFIFIFKHDFSTHDLFLFPNLFSFLTLTFDKFSGKQLLLISLNHVCPRSSFWHALDNSRVILGIFFRRMKIQITYGRRLKVGFLVEAVAITNL